MSRALRRAVLDALDNPNLGQILDRWNYPEAWAKAYEGVDFEALRGRIAGIKGAAAGRLEELAERFAAAAEARGAKVHRVASPQEALDCILRLCQESGARRIVKSKSMASEEIHLNPYLERHGLRVDETDLGEWILQLAHQRPSHMVMPALHLTRDEVAAFFSQETGEVLPGEIPRLVKVARRELRERFLEADLGITGANIAVAETGTLVLVSNEGNARLVATLPRIHVALVGLEKLVPEWRDVSPILAALPRGATSQRITSYVTCITGPVPNDDGSQKELHIVLMDNRRTAMAKDPAFREALQCIRCGSCLNVCPVFRLVGGHVFGHVYTGGIGTILTAWFHDLEAAGEFQGLCIGCGACREICPGKIDLPGLILEVRTRLARKEGLPFLQRQALAVVNHREVFHALLRAAWLAQAPFARKGYLRHLPLFLTGLGQERSLPAIAPRPFRALFRELAQPEGRDRAVFFAGCAIDFAYPETGLSLVRLLNKAGVEVLFPEEQGCCGAPHWASGAADMAAAAAAQSLEGLLEGDPRWIVVACATCATALRLEWPRLLRQAGREDLVAKAEAVAGRTLMLSELVAKLIAEGRLVPRGGLEPLRVTVHDSCHARRHGGVWREPRAALATAGCEVREMAECDGCCGMGGSYTVKYPEISMALLRRKLDHAEATGADLLCVECPGCLMQLAGGLDHRGSPLQARHLAQLLEDRFR